MRPSLLITIILLIVSLFNNSAVAGTYTLPDYNVSPPATQESNSSSSQSDRPEVWFNVTLELYQATHDQIISKLNIAKSKVDDLAKIFQLLNKQDKKQRKMPDELKEQFTTDYGDIINLMPEVYNDKKGLFETNSIKLSKIITSQIEKYNKTSASKCFYKEGAFISTKECNARIKECIDANLGSSDGQLYYNELNENYELKQIIISPEDDPNKYTVDGKEILLEKDKVLYCRLLALSKVPFKTSGYSFSDKFNENDPFSKLTSYVFIDLDIFKTNCIDNAPSKDVVTNLTILKYRYGKDFFISNTYNRYMKWNRACLNVIKNICENVYVVKGTAILSYSTVGCEIRDVTVKDVEDDIDKFKKWDVTEAQILNHTQLLDVVRICQMAYENGYFWPYKRPSLGPDCDKKGKSKSKGK